MSDHRRVAELAAMEAIHTHSIPAVAIDVLWNDTRRGHVGYFAAEKTSPTRAKLRPDFDLGGIYPIREVLHEIDAAMWVEERKCIHCQRRYTPPLLTSCMVCLRKADEPELAYERYLVSDAWVAECARRHSRRRDEEQTRGLYYFRDDRRHSRVRTRIMNRQAILREDEPVGGRRSTSFLRVPRPFGLFLLRMPRSKWVADHMPPPDAAQTPKVAHGPKTLGPQHPLERYDRQGQAKDSRP